MVGSLVRLLGRRFHNSISAFAVLLCACGPKSSGDGIGDTDTSSSDTGTDPTTVTATDGPLDGTADTGGEPGSGDAVALSINADVDLLFVIDNSGSMAGPQQSLASAATQLIDELDDGDINYRIGITTTDSGNPWCDGSTPEGGGFVLSSCRSRLPEFTNTGGINQEAACLDVCDFDAFDVMPTAASAGSTAMPRPWIDVVSGLSNISNASIGGALACALPQGVSGCGFEQPLESLFRSLLRTNDDNDPAFGFLRPNAVLGIVIFTDEADCSHNAEQETIFLPEGDRTFWSDPTAGAPTSAVCWNAGVACSGSECSSVNLDALGNETDPDSAVMRPVSRYVDLLQELEDQKQQITPDQQVVFAVIGGVGSDGSVTYQDGGDPQFVEDFGIGPGCVSSQTEAVPLVRLREVAEAMQLGDEQAMFSVCETDYSNSVLGIANQIRSQVRPACVPACAADTDPATSALEVECEVVLEQPAPDGSIVQTTLAPCNGGVPEGEEHCWTALTGDARSSYCADEGWNLEFEFEHAPGASFGQGVLVTADCALSSSPQVDCPGLQ